MDPRNSPPVNWPEKLAGRSSKLPLFIKRMNTFMYPEGHINYFSTRSVKLLAQENNVEFLGMYHHQQNRAKILPMLGLTTGSFFIRKLAN